MKVAMEKHRVERGELQDANTRLQQGQGENSSSNFNGNSNANNRNNSNFSSSNGNNYGSNNNNNNTSIVLHLQPTRASLDKLSQQKRTKTASRYHL